MRVPATPGIAWAVFALVLSGCAEQPRKQSADRPSAAALAALLREQSTPFPRRPEVAISGPLGSRANPVRVNMPQGEREYLYRLRCDDGTPPTFARFGSVGIGPYGRMLDGYRVQCGDAEPVTVYMDMYHCEEETQPIPGFSQVPEVSRRALSGCPN